MSSDNSDSKIDAIRNRLVGNRFLVTTSLPIANRANRVFEGTLFSIFDIGIKKIKIQNKEIILKRTTFWFLDNLKDTMDHVFINQKYIISFSHVPKGYTIGKKEEGASCVFSLKDLEKARIEATIMGGGHLVEVTEGVLQNMLDLDDVFLYLGSLDVKERKTKKSNIDSTSVNLDCVGCFRIINTKQGEELRKKDFFADK
jgi:hypothetical protein